MVKFNKLTILNFMSIGEAEVNLDTGGFTLIRAVNNRVEDSAGSNGSGKSSIAEAILWALTGETIRGHKEVVNRYTEGECKVKIDFNFKGQNWAVERSMSRSKEKSLRIYKNSVLLEAKGYRDSQEVLQKELPELTSKFINSVIVLGQGLPGRFTNNTPSGRKSVLEELTNADYMITQVKEGIKRRAESLSSQLRLREDSLIKVETQERFFSDSISLKESQIESLENTDLGPYYIKRSELEVNVTQLTSDLKKNEDDLVKALDLSNVSRDAWKDQESRDESHLNSLRAKLADEQARIRTNYSLKVSEDTLALKERMLKGSQLIKETQEKLDHCIAKVSGGICKTCGQTLKNVTESELDGARQQIEKYKTDLSSYEKLYSQLKDSESEIISSLKVAEDKALAVIKSAIDSEISAFTVTSSAEVGRLRRIHENLREEASRLSLRRGKISDDLRLAQEALSSVIGKLEGHTQKISQLKDEVGVLKNSLLETSKDKASLVVDIDDLKSRLSVVKQMETFASRDFRGILLEDIIHQMNEIVGNYSEVVYGNRLTNFHLEGNSIQIEFDGKEYESLSGGEQQKMNVILQLSLRDLIIELTGNTGSILFLDEIFDGLDSVGCEKMVDLIQKLDTSTFVISHHHEHLNLPYDYVLTVVKESDGVAHIEGGCYGG